MHYDFKGDFRPVHCLNRVLGISGAKLSQKQAAEALGVIGHGG